MKMLLLVRSSDDRSWETRPIELSELPREGEHIATSDKRDADWFRVQLVARVPEGQEFAAKVVCQKIGQIEIHGMTLANPAVRREGASERRGELLTEREAAERTGVSRWTIRKLIEGGKLTAMNFGTPRRKIYRVDPAALLAMQPVQAPTPRERRQRRYHPTTPQSSGPAWPPPGHTRPVRIDE
ncbi:MAG: helix-turn-helix domain-containing protein [Bacillota bacterium]